ncbi:hypothetical protein NDU88_005939 [Pleurodeles waltl]|uniref:Uncharacterized protein n=1 Tax=Pleurodeles waltl TaxID=8319 RepID=A0AAV7PKA7_PLEWA|nr:hypothetical protein NDU88_005939 [Pleurodeles waltl]
MPALRYLERRPNRSLKKGPCSKARRHSCWQSEGKRDTWSRAAWLYQTRAPLSADPTCVVLPIPSLVSLSEHVTLHGGYPSFKVASAFI